MILKCLPPSSDELYQRLIKRNSPRDRWKLSHWDEFLKREPIDGMIDHPHVLRVVTDRLVEECAQEAISYIADVLRAA